MDVICSANFKIEELTLRSIPDIDRYISDQRKENASSRCALGKLSPSSSCGIPELVVDLMFQYFGQLFVPFGELAKCPWDSTYLQGDVTRLLKTLSLTHRNWTPYAQNLLRRRLLITDHTILRHYLQSPLLGPWVRELALNYTISEDRFEHAILQDLFRRLPNVHSISVHLMDPDENGVDQEAFTGLTGFISRFCRSVKAIWLSDDAVEENDSSARYGHIFKKWTVLSKLRYLSISCEIDDVIALPPSIEVLEIQGNDKYIRYCVRALLKAKRPKSLRELSLEFSKHVKGIRTFKQFEGGAALINLEKLFIKPFEPECRNGTLLYTNIYASLAQSMLHSLDWFVDYNFTLEFLLPGCPSLRHLTLHFPFSWTLRTDETSRSHTKQQKYIVTSQKESKLLRLIQSVSRL